MYIVLDIYVYLMPLTRRVDHAVQYAYIQQSTSTYVLLTKRFATLHVHPLIDYFIFCDLIDNKCLYPPCMYNSCSLVLFCFSKLVTRVARSRTRCHGQGCKYLAVQQQLSRVELSVYLQYAYLDSVSYQVSCIYSSSVFSYTMPVVLYTVIYLAVEGQVSQVEVSRHHPHCEA